MASELRLKLKDMNDEGEEGLDEIPKKSLLGEKEKEEEDKINYPLTKVPEAGIYVSISSI